MTSGSEVVDQGQKRGVETAFRGQSYMRIAGSEIISVELAVVLKVCGSLLK